MQFVEMFRFNAESKLIISYCLEVGKFYAKQIKSELFTQIKTPFLNKHIKMRLLLEAQWILTIDRTCWFP